MKWWGTAPRPQDAAAIKRYGTRRAPPSRTLRTVQLLLRTDGDRRRVVEPFGGGQHGEAVLPAQGALHEQPLPLQQRERLRKLDADEPRAVVQRELALPRPLIDHVSVDGHRRARARERVEGGHNRRGRGGRGGLVGRGLVPAAGEQEDEQEGGEAHRRSKNRERGGRGYDGSTVGSWRRRCVSERRARRLLPWS